MASELPGIRTMIGTRVTVELSGTTYTGRLDGVTPSLGLTGSMAWIVPDDRPGIILRVPLSGASISTTKEGT